jgi:formamidopyrimidine-DNA glycosylase
MAPICTAARATVKLAVKAFIMDAKVVVGVGNIYASESLFLAGIHPNRPAGEVSALAVRPACHDHSHRSGTNPLLPGGTSLRDFVAEDGHPGYFARQLRVYGHEGQPCQQCGTAIRREKIAQRSSFFCPICQH